MRGIDITLGNMITIDTHRYSKVIAAFVERFPDATVLLDKQRPQALVANWCTNASLKRAIDFSLWSGNTELLAFHDGPRNMWASTEALPLVESLAERKLLRFHVSAPRRRSFLARLFGRRNVA